MGPRRRAVWESLWGGGGSGSHGASLGVEDMDWVII